MRIVIAPDSFKESLSADEVCAEIEAGLRRSLPDADLVAVPLADGGEGTVEALVNATGGTLVQRTVTGPLGDPVSAHYGILGVSGHDRGSSTAVVAMAEASGLHLVPTDRRDPLVTTSRGTGELIVDAIDHGVRHLVVGLGGSATNDGGAGILQALGVRLESKDGEIGPGATSLADLEVATLDQVHPDLAACTVEIAGDVENPLLGEHGASAVFGPQKGATPRMIPVLDAHLGRLADVLVAAGLPESRSRAGAGAAGGAGFALLSLCAARMRSGIDLVIEFVGLEQTLAGADLVITGEGRVDAQTVRGKAPSGVIRLAGRLGVPCVVIGGVLGAGAGDVLGVGASAVLGTVAPGTPRDEALHHAADNLRLTAERLGRTIQERGVEAVTEVRSEG